MEKFRPNISKALSIHKSKAWPETIDFWGLEEKCRLDQMYIEEQSTSLFSYHFITPEKYEEPDLSEFKLRGVQDVDFGLSCISKGKSSYLTTPTEKPVLINEKEEKDVTRKFSTDSFKQEAGNMDIGSLELLKLVMMTKSHSPIINSLTDNETSANMTHNKGFSLGSPKFKTLRSPFSDQSAPYKLIEPSHNLVPIQKSQTQKHMSCKCSKSKCLKLYCECFANQQGCGPHCNCVGCYNNDQYTVLKKLVVSEILEKNPKAFNNKFKRISKNDLILHSRGCHCKKTGCIKKYCECFAEGLKCTNVCSCQGCDNCGPKLEKELIIEVHEVMKRKRKRKKAFVNILIERIEKAKNTAHQVE